MYLLKRSAAGLYDEGQVLSCEPREQSWSEVSNEAMRLEYEAEVAKERHAGRKIMFDAVRQPFDQESWEAHRRHSRLQPVVNVWD